MVSSKYESHEKSKKVLGPGAFITNTACSFMYDIWKTWTHTYLWSFFDTPMNQEAPQASCTLCQKHEKILAPCTKMMSLGRLFIIFLVMIIGEQIKNTYKFIMMCSPSKSCEGQILPKDTLIMIRVKFSGVENAPILTTASPHSRGQKLWHSWSHSCGCSCSHSNSNSRNNIFVKSGCHCKPKTPLHYPNTCEWTKCKVGI